MDQYLALAKRILTDEETSYVDNNRTGMDTLTFFGPQIKPIFDKFYSRFRNPVQKVVTQV